MEIENGAPRGAHRVSSYGDGYFVIGETRYEGSIIVTPERVITDWPPRSVEQLDAAAMEIVGELDAEVVLLGTGREHRFPDLGVVGPVMARGVGVEIMSSDAACRTYNILMSEGRRVAALLISVV